MSVSNFPTAPVDLFNEPAFPLGRFQARPAVREIEIDHHVERLEPRVFQVLVVLARSRNRTISRDALIAQCWSGRFVSDDALNRTIGKLRQLFVRDPSGSVTIETAPRLGYQMRVTPADDAAGPGLFCTGDEVRTPPQVLGVLDDLRDAPDRGYRQMDSEPRIVMSETLQEAGRILSHALHAIEMSAGRGGAQLKLTIEMTTLECRMNDGSSAISLPSRLANCNRESR